MSHIRIDSIKKVTDSKINEISQRQLKRNASGFYFAYTDITSDGNKIYSYGSLSTCTSTFMAEFDNFLFVNFIEINNEHIVDSITSAITQLAKENKEHSSSHIGDLIKTLDIDMYIFAASKASHNIVTNRDRVSVTSLIPFSQHAKNTDELERVAKVVIDYRKEDVKLKLIDGAASLDQLERIAKVIDTLGI